MPACPSEEELGRYVAGACTAEQTAAIEAHLSSCARCSAWVKQARAAPVEETIPSDDLVETEVDGDRKGTEPASLTIRGYELVKELHRGGQGVVYQAIQESTRRRVAIKVMREGPFASAADKARFEREVQVLGQLNHPNIVNIHDSGTAAGSFYYVMDYISGRPLDDHVTLAKPSLDDTLRLFAKICDAVNAAHLRGVIHRDLKPGNIRIDAEGEPHILDFGLAKVATGQVTDGTTPQVMSLTGQFMGSLPWASPEQAEGIPSKIDIRTDVYSLGVVLYHMLTGRFPYEVVGNIRDVMDRIMNTEPARPSTIRVAAGPRTGRINDEIDTIVLKSLAKERERRYQTAGELARDIRHYLSGEPIEAKRDSAWYVLRKSLRRYKRMATLVTVILVVVSGSVVTMMTQSARVAREHQRSLVAQRRENARALLAWLDSRGTGQEDCVELQRQKEILQRINDRIRSGEAGALERQAFVRAFLTARVIGRSLVTAADLPAIQLSLRCSSQLSDAGSLGVLVVSYDVRLDGEPVTRGLSEGLLVEPPGSSTVSYWERFSILTDVELGRHAVRGNIAVQIVEILQDFNNGRVIRPSAEADVDYRVLPGAPVDVPIPPFTTTVVDRYPENYPPEIVDDQLVQEISSGFILEQIALGFPDWRTAEDVKLGTEPVPHLFLRMSYPAPRVTLACAVTLSAVETGWCKTYTLVASNDAWHIGSLGGGGGGFGVSRHAKTAEQRHVVKYAFALNEHCRGAIDVGTPIRFEMIASQTVARALPEVSEYLHVEIERATRVTHYEAEE